MHSHPEASNIWIRLNKLVACFRAIQPHPAAVTHLESYMEVESLFTRTNELSGQNVRETEIKPRAISIPSASREYYFDRAWFQSTV